MIIALLFLINLSLSNNSVKGTIIFTICVFIIACIYWFLTKEERLQEVNSRKIIKLLKKENNSIYLSEQKVNLAEDKITHSILHKKFSMKIDERINLLVNEEFIFIYTNNFKELKKRILYYCNIPVTPCIVIPITSFTSDIEMD